MRPDCERPRLIGLLHRACRAAAALASLAALAPGAAWPDTTIRFDPPTGTTFVESARFTRSSLQDGKSGPAQTVLGETRYVIRRDAAGGYTVTTSPNNPPDLRADADTAAMLAGMVSAMELEWDLDERGHLVRVRGLQAALRQLEPVKPLLDAVLAALSSQGTSLQAFAERGWRERGLLGVMTGWQVPAEDRTITRKATQQVPGIGPVACDMSIRFTPGPPCPGGPCVKVEFRYESHDPAIGKGMATMLRQSMINVLKAMAPNGDLSGIDVPVFVFTGARLEDVDVRVIDARTGLPHGQQFKRTISGRARVEGDAKTSDFSTVETQDYRFTYEALR